MTEPLSSAGVLEHVDPNTLTIELNVRTEASLTKQFIASIAENGVLVPIVAIRNTDGTLQVRAGQRRTLAAREAGLTSVPVYITDAEQDAATRLVQQITENDQRLALDAGDRVQGIQALLDTGMSVTKVAKRLAVSAERVKQSKVVAGSPVAMEALHGRTATLAEAAGIAEFEDDPDAVARLLRAAGRNYFEQELERMRRVREEQAERLKAVAAYEELGYTVLDSYPGYDSGQVPLSHLLTDGGVEGGDLVAVDESVVRDPKHWSVLLDEEEVFTLTETGELIDETTIDWSTETDPEAVPAEGKVHADAVTESIRWVPSGYFCHDPDAAGLLMSEHYEKLSAAAANLPEGTKVESSEDLAVKAELKAERRRVIELNKAGDAAGVWRRKFIADLLKRKTPPKGAMLFVTERLLVNGTLLGGYKGDEVASSLLGTDVRTGEILDHAGDPRAEVVLLGLTLGALESATPKSAWRGPSQESVALLRFLQGLGYTLSPVEQVAVGDKTADECLAELSE